ncbi:MAG: imidazole glycerol phosphate synthase subunit HisH [Limnochordia bacterium]|nr:imidazole glycerol phosphate synthase subunit HisH [Bacillota bacterium]HOB08594.1 imidazole glycerol phosphate synthase subunit HisH [Limnochordia bacterium]NLH31268.1 imidazole glycerol phosphate synthase subunit HisH [Bacillota bacterium]HPT92742.1 imidazole glycerol phosphate synthase subunit HisH [Limnochordia bacterium]HPZ30735.1 imidazole glycerol phosphate synthase subunit HisH [Limnochordia bacterium]
MIGVIDYKAGNAPSVVNALRKLGIDCELVSTPEKLQGLAGVILPGVGSASATIASLAELGFLAELEDFVLRKQRPFLGICVGMQILFEHSEELDTKCLGWLKGRVRRFPPEVRVPQIGWNRVSFTYGHPLAAGIKSPAYFYFVNSYYAAPEAEEIILGTAEYGVRFCAALASGNIFATQYHVEKSGIVGLKMLQNFAAIVGGKPC